MTRSGSSFSWLSAVAFALACTVAAGDRLTAQGPIPIPTTADYVPHELIVRLRDGGSAATLVELFSKLGAVGVKTFETLDGLYVITLPDALDVATANRLAKALGSVAYAEPNYVVRTQTIAQRSELPRREPLGPAQHRAVGRHRGADIHAPGGLGHHDRQQQRRRRGDRHRHRLHASRISRPTCSATRPTATATASTTTATGYIDDCYGIDTVNHDSDPMDDNGHGTHTAGTVGAVRQQRRRRGRRELEREADAVQVSRRQTARVRPPTR